MAERLHRTQILLEPEQYRALGEIARHEGRSLSEVVRELIRQQLEQRQQMANADLQRRLEGLARIRRHREEMLARLGGRPLEIEVPDLIRQMRDERDDRNLAG